ncbi:uncharacterized protein TNCV_942741 [Trichonephila clavipes]|nr:uncharacterized protein TNCV_942741 [Trichonephila clavipes]
MFLAGHPSQGCFGLQSHCAPCYFFNEASFYPSDFSFSVVGKIFSWKGFGPMSKLGYFGYLIHYIVITFHVSNARSTIIFSHYENWMRISGYTLVTFFAAYVLYVTFESPLTYIESFFLPSRPANENLQNNIKQNVNIEGIVPTNEIIPPNTTASWNLKNSTYISDEHSKL